MPLIQPFEMSAYKLITLLLALCWVLGGSPGSTYHLDDSTTEDAKIIKLLNDRMAAMEKESPETLNKYRFLIEASDVRAEKCKTGYIEKLNIYLKQDVDGQGDYLRRQFNRQIDLCFNNLLNDFIKADSMLDDGQTRADFDHFVKLIGPEFVDPQDFAYVTQYDKRYDEILDYLEYKAGLKEPYQTDISQIRSYSSLLELCGRVYRTYFDAAGLMLFLLHLKPQKASEMSPELLSRYNNYKVAFDMTLRGRQNLDELMEFARSRGRIGRQISFMDKIGGYFKCLWR